MDDETKIVKAIEYLDELIAIHTGKQIERNPAALLLNKALALRLHLKAKPL